MVDRKRDKIGWDGGQEAVARGSEGHEPAGGTWGAVPLPRLPNTELWWLSLRPHPGTAERHESVALLNIANSLVNK